MERSELEFALSEEQEMLRQTVRDFAEGQVRPSHEHVDHEAVHPVAWTDGLRELGLFGVLVPAERGGVGMGALAHVLCVETLAEAAGAAGAIVVAHGAATEAIAAAPGRDELVQELASGAVFGAPALLETDPGVVQCRATEGAAPRLSGRKTLVPFPGRAGAYVVLAVDPAGAPGLYLVRPGAEGLRHEEREETLGLLGLETAALVLTNTPAEKLGGAESVARMISGLRISVGALLAGLGRGALGHALRYAGERKQFDKPLLDFVAMQERLARGDWRVAAARAAVHAAARLRDRGEPHALAAARARAFAGEAALGAADESLQVYGGYGYSREYPAERFYRDARFTGFGEARPAALVADVVRGMLG